MASSLGSLTKRQGIQRSFGQTGRKSVLLEVGEAALVRKVPIKAAAGLGWPWMRGAFGGCWACLQVDDLNETCSRLLQAELQPALRLILGKHHWLPIGYPMLKQTLGREKFPILVMRYMLGVLINQHQALVFPASKEDVSLSLTLHPPTIKGRELRCSARGPGSRQYVLAPWTHS